METTIWLVPWADPPPHSHSLGILIEWKLHPLNSEFHLPPSYSHSLGILIEWKRVVVHTDEIGSNYSHSLGILIE